MSPYPLQKGSIMSFLDKTQEEMTGADTIKTAFVISTIFVVVPYASLVAIGAGYSAYKKTKDYIQEKFPRK